LHKKEHDIFYFISEFPMTTFSSHFIHTENTSYVYGPASFRFPTTKPQHF